MGCFSLGGVLGSPQPAWEVLSHVFMPSLLQLHRNVAETKKPPTIHLPSFKLIHHAQTCMHAHNHFLCVQVYSWDQIFSLRCWNINFLLIPLRLAPLLFFHPWHARRKTAGLVYTDKCISITWNARLLAVNPFDPSLSALLFFLFFSPLTPCSQAEPIGVSAAACFGQTDSRRETCLTLLPVEPPPSSITHTLHCSSRLYTAR